MTSAKHKYGFFFWYTFKKLKKIALKNKLSLVNYFKQTIFSTGATKTATIIGKLLKPAFQ
jgi:hypothetical protein|tara:strand:+ start:433 stop:612 length:180 start_codon:yes stop_codon:yes gene_type:complete